MSQRPLTKRLVLCILTLTLICPTLVTAAPGPAARVASVDCSSGDTVAAALSLPADEIIVEISGTCVEDITIKRSRVTLRGVTPDAALQGDAETPGPAVLLQGALNIDVQNLSISGGENVGVRIQRNSEARLRNVRLTETPFFGLLVEEASSVLLADTSITDHGILGVAVFGDSGLTVQGSVDVSRNGQIGLFMSSGASLHSNGVGDLVANDNGAFGLLLQAGSKGLFPSVEARNNGVSGLDMSFGGEFFSIGTNDFSNNGVFGISLGDGARYFAAGQVSDNGSVGIFAEEGSHVNVATDVPSRIGGSPVAVILEGATGTFGGTTQQADTVTIDGLMELTFGSRASFGADVIVGNLSCDGTVLTQGAIACPSSLSAVENLSLEIHGARLRHELPQTERPVLPTLP